MVSSLGPCVNECQNVISPSNSPVSSELDASFFVSDVVSPEEESHPHPVSKLPVSITPANNIANFFFILFSFQTFHLAIFTCFSLFFLAPLQYALFFRHIAIYIAIISIFLGIFNEVLSH